MNVFNPFYISLILVFIIFLLSFIVRNKRTYASFIATLIIITKISQIAYLSYLRNSLYYNFNIELVGFCLMFTVIFLLSKSNLFYNLSYFFSFHVIANVIEYIYGHHSYRSNIQNFFILFLDFLIILSILYAGLFLGKRININGLTISILTFIAIIISNFILSSIIGIRIINIYNDIEILNYIKHLGNYVFILLYTVLNILIMYIMYAIKR